MDAIADVLSAGKDAFTLSQFGSGKMPSFQPVRAVKVSSSLSGSKFQVTDANTRQQLYTIKISSLSGNITMTDASGMECATSKTHSFSYDIDVVVRGQQMKLKKSKAARGAKEYQSPAYPGATRIWKDSGTGEGFDVVCVDEKGQALALYHVKSASMSNYGTLELAAPVAGGGPPLEELLITGTMVVQARITKFVHAVT